MQVNDASLAELFASQDSRMDAQSPNPAHGIPSSSKIMLQFRKELREACESGDLSDEANRVVRAVLAGTLSFRALSDETVFPVPQDDAEPESSVTHEKGGITWA